MEKEKIKSFRMTTGKDAQAIDSKTLGGIVGLIVLGGIIWFYFGGGLEKQAQVNMDNISQQVAQDAIAQYKIAGRGGDLIEVCVHAGLVSAAFLQAKDEPNYLVWKEIESDDCKRAGVR